jgi:hypothetical protein
MSVVGRRAIAVLAALFAGLVLFVLWAALFWNGELMIVN